MSRLQTINIVTNAGGTETLTIQDYEEGTDMDFWGSEFDEAVDGSLRSNARGFRKSFTLKYKLCIEPSEYRSICNNIATDLLGDYEFFYIGIDNDNLFRVTLDDGFLHEVNYANQHGLFVPALKLKGYEVFGLTANIELEFEDWRFVNEAVTEARDYGLITDAVTTSIDYGSIV